MKATNRTLGLLVLCMSLVCSTLGLAQDWPQWRGPNRDNKVMGFTEPKTWPRELTKKWKVPVGVGEASPVLVGDKVYTFGREGGDEVTRCLDAATGKEIWKDRIPAAAVTGPANGYPGPRSTPAVGEGKVCTLGVHGVVSCLDAASGQIVWRKMTSQKPLYYTSTSPIIVDGKCVVFIAALTAFDLKTGDPKWTWNGGTPYGSPILATIDGVKQVITPAMDTLAGVDLADGKELWKNKISTGYQSTYSTPLVEGNIVYYSVAGGGKKAGAAGMTAFKVEKKGVFMTTDVWSNGYSANGYHTPVIRDGLLFGCSAAGKNFYCLNAKTGEQLWKDAKARGNCGSILDAGTVMIALTSDKDLLAFRPSAKGYEEIARYPASTAETWCVPIVAGNRIYVKDKAGDLTLWTIE